MVARLRRGIEARGIRPQKVILYGSYADGTQREGSDIDVLIVSDDFAEKGYWERIDILADAIYKIFAPIEAVAMTSEEWERKEGTRPFSRCQGKTLLLSDACASCRGAWPPSRRAPLTARVPAPSEWCDAAASVPDALARPSPSGGSRRGAPLSRPRWPGGPSTL